MNFRWQARLAAAVLAVSLLLASCSTGRGAVRLAASWTELGNAYAELGKWDKAGEAWAAALALDPGQAIAGYNLSRSLAEAGKYPEAVAAADSVLGGDPGNAAVLALKAYALHKAGRDREALEVYDRVVEINGDDSASRFNRAVLLEAVGRKDEALQAYLGLLSEKKGDPDASLRAGILLASLDRPDDALPYLERYVESAPRSIQGLRILATVRQDAGLYMKAMEAWDKLLAAEPGDAAGWFSLARLKLGVAGDSAGGLEALKKAVKAGFGDEKAAGELLQMPGLVSASEVAAILSPLSAGQSQP